MGIIEDWWVGLSAHTLLHLAQRSLDDLTSLPQPSSTGQNWRKSKELDSVCIVERKLKQIRCGGELEGDSLVPTLLAHEKLWIPARLPSPLTYETLRVKAHTLIVLASFTTVTQLQHG